MARFAYHTAGFMLCSALIAPALFAAAKEPEKPDREMLRMMELLKEMEMLQQMEMVRAMGAADNAEEAPREADTRKVPPPAKNKGTSK